MRNWIRWGIAVLAVLWISTTQWPAGLLVIPLALIIGGIVARRQTQNPNLRALAAGAIATGAIGVLLVLVLAGRSLIGFMSS
jgi:hypothetical protein